MGRIGVDLTERMIINQWVSFPIERGILEGISQYESLKDLPELKNLEEIPALGYVYVDHDAGTSLHVAGVYLPERDSSARIDVSSESLRNSVVVRLRYDFLKILDLHVLTDDERLRLSPPGTPEWVQYYETPVLKVIRDCRAIDPLRAEGYFDDVRSLIPPTERLDPGSGVSTTMNPEQVWVRLEEYVQEEKSFTGTLLNQPYQKFGVNAGDTVSLWPVKMDGELILVVEVR